MVDTTTLWPVTLHAGSDQVLVTRHKEEVVIDQLLADILGHAEQREVVASKISLELLECVLHEVLDIQTLDASDTGRETKALNAAAHTDSENSKYFSIAT